MAHDWSDFPLDERAEAISHQLPLLTERAALDAYLADRRTQRLRHQLRHSPLHRTLWERIEGEIAAALAWAEGEPTPQEEPAAHD